MNILDMRANANAIIDRLNKLESSNDVEANKTALISIHAAADEITGLAEENLLNLK